MNTISWFDLPVLDLQRAMAFYSTLLETDITEEFPGVAVFSHTENDVSGCLCLSTEHQPSRDGALLYFNVAGRLDSAVALVEDLGGQIEQAAHDIGPFGRRAIVLDSEGNRIALYSAQ
ncbi:VOC family protein [Planctobacterium marinum]|uniref:VOC family protein n=1 Tax=Planctobacterium marinum TaxID=1631968 RepID=UPI001E659693|nr:VOC family protein [Planctobacterium marinum]MCC2607684.1 VOC family protein [Planctobacterium marinum]